MFAILAAIVVMCGLSLARVPVVFALIIGAVTGGLLAGLGLQGTMEAFNNGLGKGANIALAYGVLGAFALALAKSGLPDLLRLGPDGMDSGALGRCVAVGVFQGTVFLRCFCVFPEHLRLHR